MAVVFSSVFPAGCAERHSRLSRIAAKRVLRQPKKQRVPMKMHRKYRRLHQKERRLHLEVRPARHRQQSCRRRLCRAMEIVSAELPGYGNMGDRGTGVTYTLITVVPDEVSSFDKDGGQDVSVSSSSGTAPDQIPAAVVVALPDPVAPVVAPSAARDWFHWPPRPVRRLFWRRCGIAVNLFWARCSMVRQFPPGRWLAAC